MSIVISVLFAGAALLGASFAIMEFRMLWRFVRHRAEIRSSVKGSGRTPGDTPPGEPPTVTIQLPLYNERRVAEQIVRAAAAQDYPRERFDVQVLDDSTDETVDIVAAVVAELRDDGVRIEHIRRGNRDGYKAGALAEGLERSQADFVAIFDADFVPAPDFLERILVEEDAFHDSDVAFVQARWAWHEPRGLLDATLALLLDRHFFVQKPTRHYFGGVTAFNGSAGIWRRAAVDAAGGWSAATLTEDLDLSYRSALKGWRGLYLHDVTVVNELPDHMRALKQQQHRWAKGNAQCFRDLTGRVIASKDMLRDRLDEAFFLAGYAIHPVLLLNLLLWPWAVLFMDRTVFLVVQAIMAIVFIVAPVTFALTVIERDSKLTLASVGQILTGVCLGTGLMVNNTAGQLQGFLSHGGEFVRTPKAHNVPGAQEAKGGARRPRVYDVPLHWTFFAELGLIVYSVASAATLVANGEALWALPMVFFAASLSLVVQLQLAPSPA